MSDSTVPAVPEWSPKYMVRVVREVIKHDVLCGDYKNPCNYSREKLSSLRSAAWRQVSAALRADCRRFPVMYCAYVSTTQQYLHTNVALSTGLKPMNKEPLLQMLWDFV
ncbi:uncharacterized protein LOC126378553 [Pectinophora gossypiella]|uniref:uncharacterized protein LOC126378553 n=1 Tax=Pectinophora gossypiella TaxID=13191 RepID=UPI00214F370A|nr:uncharacterized protein LOC126378553 [Pectinophora gossypiella]